MNIIRVVHGDTIQNFETEKRLASLETFDINSFLLKHELEIVKQSTSMPIKESIDVVDVLGGVAYGFAFPLYGLYKVTKAAMQPKSEDLQVNVKDVIRHTVSTLMQEICTNLSENIEIITLALAKQRYPRSLNLSIGTYSLHPYDSERLTLLEHYHKNLALEKDNELIVLLGKMGAKTVTILEIDGQQRSGSGSLHAGVDIVSVEARGNLSLAQRVEQGKELQVFFEGNVVDIPPNLLTSSLWFGNDGQLNSIFESRRFTPNKIRDYTLQNTYTETFDFDFDLAAKHVAVKTDLHAEYEVISKKQRFFHVEFGK